MGRLYVSDPEPANINFSLDAEKNGGLRPDIERLIVRFLAFAVYLDFRSFWLAELAFRRVPRCLGMLCIWGV
jgi:hypothetical protein